jgi:hypothetical protein
MSEHMHNAHSFECRLDKQLNREDTQKTGKKHTYTHTRGHTLQWVFFDPTAAMCIRASELAAGFAVLGVHADAELLTELVKKKTRAGSSRRDVQKCDFPGVSVGRGGGDKVSDWGGDEVDDYDQDGGMAADSNEICLNEDDMVQVEAFSEFFGFFCVCMLVV